MVAGAAIAGPAINKPIAVSLAPSQAAHILMCARRVGNAQRKQKMSPRALETEGLTLAVPRRDSAWPHTTAIAHPPVSKLELVCRPRWPLGAMMRGHDYGGAARYQILHDAL
jgi:hypothetical protein